MKNKLLSAVFLFLMPAAAFVIPSTSLANDMAFYPLYHTYAVNLMRIYPEKSKAYILSTGREAPFIPPKLIEFDLKKRIKTYSIDLRKHATSPASFVRYKNDFFISDFESDLVLKVMLNRATGIVRSIPFISGGGWGTEPQPLLIVGNRLVAGFTNYDSEEPGILFSKKLSPTGFGDLSRYDLNVENPRELVKTGNDTFVTIAGAWGDGIIFLNSIDPKGRIRELDAVHIGKFPYKATFHTPSSTLIICDAGSPTAHVFKIKHRKFKKLKNISLQKYGICSGVVYTKYGPVFALISSDKRGKILVKNRVINLPKNRGEIFAINSLSFLSSNNELWFIVDSRLPAVGVLKLNSE